MIRLIAGVNHHRPPAGSPIPVIFRVPCQLRRLHNLLTVNDLALHKLQAIRARYRRDVDRTTATAETAREVLSTDGRVYEKDRKIDRKRDPTEVEQKVEMSRNPRRLRPISAVRSSCGPRMGRLVAL
jgi:hypothetical protein